MALIDSHRRRPALALCGTSQKSYSVAAVDQFYERDHVNMRCNYRLVDYSI